MHLSTDFFTGIVCPVIGIVLSNAMFLVPLPAVNRARKRIDMKELNPTPWVAAFSYCLGYTLYAILQRNLYILLAFWPGLLLTVYYVLSAISVLSSLCTDTTTRISCSIQAMFIFGLFFWIILAMVCSWMYSGENSRDSSADLIGTFSAIVCVFYYAAPLSSFKTVLTTRNSRPIHVPTICVNLVNSSLWCAYGYYELHKPQLWVPNGIGACLSAIALLLLLICERRAVVPSATEPLYHPIIQTEAQHNPVTTAVAVYDINTTTLQATAPPGY